MHTKKENIPTSQSGELWADQNYSELITTQKLSWLLRKQILGLLQIYQNTNLIVKNKLNAQNY